MTLSLSALSEGICDYLKVMAHSDFTNGTFDRHARVLRYFYRYIKGKKIDWNAVFTDETVAGFLDICPIDISRAVIRGFSRYLYYEKKINNPIGYYHPILPEIFNRYLAYKSSLQKDINPDRIVLTGLSGYMNRHGKSIKDIRVEDLDDMLFSLYGHLNPDTQNKYKSCLRVFLRYLYVKKIIRKNLAPLIINRRVFADTKLPECLDPASIEKLFASLKRDTPRDLRVNAMVYLAYSLGLRPSEINRITMDDISFKTMEVTIGERKNYTPDTLPLPGDAVKSIAAYVVGARPKSKERALFLSLRPDHKPFTDHHVAKEISMCMKRAGLSASSYALRHTYAQSLLENDISIFEIKEMMGHKHIQTTQKYIHIHTRLMRKVLFDEEI